MKALLLLLLATYKVIGGLLYEVTANGLVHVYQPSHLFPGSWEYVYSYVAPVI